MAAHKFWTVIVFQYFMQTVPDIPDSPGQYFFLIYDSSFKQMFSVFGYRRKFHLMNFDEFRNSQRHTIAITILSSITKIFSLGFSFRFSS